MKDNKEARLYKIFVGNKFKDGHTSSGSQSVIRKETVEANKTNLKALAETIDVMKTPAPFANHMDDKTKEKPKKEPKDCVAKFSVQHVRYEIQTAWFRIYLLPLEEKSVEEEKKKAAEKSIKLPHPEFLTVPSFHILSDFSEFWFDAKGQGALHQVDFSCWRTSRDGRNAGMMWYAVCFRIRWY